MSDFFDALDSDQIDALQEIGNIGSGHSASALADLLNRKIEMSLPRFYLLTPKEFGTVQWSEFKESSDTLQTLAVSICQTKGDLDSDIIVVLNEKTIKYLLTIINKDFSKDTTMTSLGNFDKSIILEIGSILSLHYLTAINTFLNLKSFPETPYLAIDNAETILNKIVDQLEKNVNKLLLIECDIFTTDIQMKPIVIFAPHANSVEKTINAMFGY